jgi:hypothetical protein
MMSVLPFFKPTASILTSFCLSSASYKDTKSTASELPFGNLVWVQPFFVEGLLFWLMSKLCPYFFEQSFPVGFSEPAKILDRFCCEFDLEH